MDDELNILPISSHMKLTTVSSIIEDQESLPGEEQDLLSLKEQLLDVFPDGPLVGMSATFDQGRMNIEKQQILSLFRKVVTKMSRYFHDVLMKDFVSSFPQGREVSLMPHSISVDDDLEDGAKEVMEKMKTENACLLNPDSLQQYSIADREAGFEDALRSCATISSSGLISVKSNRSEKDKVVKNKPKVKREKGKEAHKRHPTKLFP